MKGKLSISVAENYLTQLEQLMQEIDYTRNEFSYRLKRYLEDANPQTRIDLQSYIALYEKYILPLTTIQQIEEIPFEGEEILTFGSDGYWGAYEFRQMFEGIDYLNKIYTIRSKFEREAPDFRLREGITRAPIYHKAQLYYYLSPREELHVSQIQFGSPGLVSFEGIGEIIKEIRKTFDYLITGSWLKRVIDTYRQIKDREIREARKKENEVRIAEAKARLAEANAREYEAILRQIEASSKIKNTIHQIREQDKHFEIISSEQTEKGIKQLDGLADTAIKMEAHNLARLPVVEDDIIYALSVLFRLIYESQKIKTGKMVE